MSGKDTKTDCKRCGNEFTRNTGKEKYCSYICATGKRVTTTKCKNCGLNLEGSNSYRDYCSPRCGQKYRKEDKYKKVDKSKRELANCKECFRDFYKTKHNQKYCSSECTRSHHNRKYHSNKKQTDKTYTVICKMCGNAKEFTDTKYSVRKYCSAECLTQYGRIRAKHYYARKTDSTQDHVDRIVTSMVTKGKEARTDTYNGTVLNSYHLNGFPPTKSESIKRRDGFHCQVCNSKTLLEVHHIVKQVYGGTHDESNLITLCTSCHRAVDTLDLEYAKRKCYKNATEPKQQLLNSGIDNKELLKVLKDNYYYITQQSDLNIELVESTATKIEELERQIGID